jgi:hypothetical protein
MPRVKKPAVTKPRITVTTVALTAAEGQVLHRLREEATDRIGRKISASAVLRALVQWAGKNSTLPARKLSHGLNTK